MSRMTWLSGLLALLFSVSMADAARAQFTERIIDFEKDCAGNSLTSGFDVLGYKQVARNLFAPCGVASITSGGSGSLGAQQLHNPLDPPFGPGSFPGQGAGEVVLSGALSFNGSLSFGPLEILFSPAVHEVSFDLLDLDNPHGLNIVLEAAGGANIPVAQQPTVTAKRAHFSQQSSTPIERVIVNYEPGPLVDGWFVDTLRFNVWNCGDGEMETGEECDDANGVMCDGCRNDCRTDIVGCLDGTSCIAHGSSAADSFGCATCDTSAAPQASGEILPSPAALGQSCDDGLFCSQAEACDGAGACTGSPRPCDDGAECTVDSCNEAQDQCVHTIATGCLIQGVCFANGETNSQDPCQACDRARSTTGWSIKAAGSRCGDPSCLGGVLTPAPLCSDGGACEAQTPVPCDGAVCANEQSCTGDCQDDDDCLSENHCESDLCEPDDPDGAPCTRGAECESGFCVDGVCCNAACDRTCESCSLSGSVGVCTPHPSGSDPEGECPDAQQCAAPGVCAPEDRPDGASCDRDAVCKNGHCADGVCCNRACDGVCEACNSSGQCSPHEAGKNPENECRGEQVCSGGSSCVSYETRGNGLCSARRGDNESDAHWAWWLAACAGVLGARRRRGLLCPRGQRGAS